MAEGPQLALLSRVRASNVPYKWPRLIKKC